MQEDDSGAVEEQKPNKQQMASDFSQPEWHRVMVTDVFEGDSSDWVQVRFLDRNWSYPWTRWSQERFAPIHTHTAPVSDTIPDAGSESTGAADSSSEHRSTGAHSHASAESVSSVGMGDLEEKEGRMIREAVGKIFSGEADLVLDQHEQSPLTTAQDRPPTPGLLFAEQATASRTSGIDDSSAAGVEEEKMSQEPVSMQQQQQKPQQREHESPWLSGAGQDGSESGAAEEEKTSHDSPQRQFEQQDEHAWLSGTVEGGDDESDPSAPEAKTPSAAEVSPVAAQRPPSSVSDSTGTTGNGDSLSGSAESGSGAADGTVVPTSSSTNAVSSTTSLACDTSSQQELSPPSPSMLMSGGYVFSPSTTAVSSKPMPGTAHQESVPTVCQTVTAPVPSPETIPTVSQAVSAPVPSSGPVQTVSPTVAAQVPKIPGVVPAVSRTVPRPAAALPDTVSTNVRAVTGPVPTDSRMVPGPGPNSEPIPTVSQTVPGAIPLGSQTIPVPVPTVPELVPTVSVASDLDVAENAVPVGETSEEASGSEAMSNLGSQTDSGLATPALSPTAPLMNHQSSGSSSSAGQGSGRDESLGGSGIGEGQARKTRGRLNKARTGVVPTRELTPHVVEVVEGGQLEVTVFRQNKQVMERVVEDDVPMPIKMGKYDTEYEAARAAECFSSPIWHEHGVNSRCAICTSAFKGLKRKHHCRNCGRLVCGNCAGVFWPSTMLPKPYRVDKREKTVRICNPCHESGERFRQALLTGSEEEARSAYETGCVNLRVPYSVYFGELPVHCAAAGGNVELLRWLLEDRCCPVYADREKTVALGDRQRRTVMGAAAASGQTETMRYLVTSHGFTVQSIENTEELWNALEACLLSDDDDFLDYNEAKTSSRPRELFCSSGGTKKAGAGINCYTRGLWRFDSGREEIATSGVSWGRGEEPMYLPYTMPRTHDNNVGASAEVVGTEGIADNACLVCWSKKVDCTLVPCGHHCCCQSCAATFESCPICAKTIQKRIRAINV